MQILNEASRKRSASQARNTRNRKVGVRGRSGTGYRVLDSQEEPGEEQVALLVIKVKPEFLEPGGIAKASSKVAKRKGGGRMVEAWQSVKWQ